jgi:hypothetical protein
MTKQHRILVALNLPQAVPALIDRSLHFVKSITGNPNFTSFDAALGVVSALITQLQADQHAVEAGGNSATAKRDGTEHALRTALTHLGDDVQHVADASPERAQEIITSAGMDVRAASTHHKHEYEIYDGTTSGTVGIRLLSAAKRASYTYRWSADEKTWNTSGAVLQAEYVFHGLTAGETIFIQWQISDKDGPHDWSLSHKWIVR